MANLVNAAATSWGDFLFGMPTDPNRLASAPRQVHCEGPDCASPAWKAVEGVRRDSLLNQSPEQNRCHLCDGGVPTRGADKKRGG
jgi:hypothetical protein